MSPPFSSRSTAERAGKSGGVCAKTGATHVNSIAKCKSTSPKSLLFMILGNADYSGASSLLKTRESVPLWAGGTDSCRDLYAYADEASSSGSPDPPA